MKRIACIFPPFLRIRSRWIAGGRGEFRGELYFSSEILLLKFRSHVHARFSLFSTCTRARTGGWCQDNRRLERRRLLGYGGEARCKSCHNRRFCARPSGGWYQPTPVTTTRNLFLPTTTTTTTIMNMLYGSRNKSILIVFEAFCSTAGYIIIYTSELCSHIDIDVRVF